MSLRYDALCSRCAAPVSARSRAWWDPAAKQVTCLACLPCQNEMAAVTSAAKTAAVTLGTTAAPVVLAALAPPLPIDHGVGGISASNEFNRRVVAHQQQIEAKWGTGRIGRFAKFMSDEPQTTLAWAKGAEGERQLARRLTDGLGDVAIVLHDRKVPKTRGNIDHLVIAANGIWIVDAKNYTGKVELRDIGGWLSTNNQLYVGERNQTKLTTGLEWQIQAVRAALTPVGYAEMPVHPALCFTNSEWGLFPKPIHFGGVLITWPAKLLEAIRAPGILDAATIDMLARQLSSKLPAST